MTRYTTAVSFRQALEARLKQQSDRSGIDLGRLRRRVVFERLAARLSQVPPGRWVLKGGAAMEFRLLDLARQTKDLDLALRDGGIDGGIDGGELQEELIETLALDEDLDGFVFRVGAPVALDADAAGRPAWRFGVAAQLGGKQFAGVRIDVAARGDEIAATEYVDLPGVLAFADVPRRRIEAVHRRQHFAEKLHALTRDYGLRPNTRVKDLVDLILLIETGLAADAELVATARHVFAVRATHALPKSIPDPPPTWAAEYSQTAAGLAIAANELASALTLLRGFWAAALNADHERDA